MGKYCFPMLCLLFSRKYRARKTVSTLLLYTSPRPAAEVAHRTLGSYWFPCRSSTVYTTKSRAELSVPEGDTQSNMSNSFCRKNNNYRLNLATNRPITVRAEWAPVPPSLGLREQSACEDLLDRNLEEWSPPAM